jgi:hypothetical protein
VSRLAKAVGVLGGCLIVLCGGLWVFLAGTCAMMSGVSADSLSVAVIFASPGVFAIIAGLVLIWSQRPRRAPRS